jgi:hypothetical protein
MTSNIRIPDEDLAEANWLEARAKQTDNQEEAVGLMLMVNYLRTPPHYPVLDDPRTEDLGRDVIEEFGVITPYFPQDDSCRTLPVRLVHDQGGGLQIELGHFNLGMRELRVLHRAINVLLKWESESRSAAGRTGTAERADPNQDDQVHGAPVLDLDAKRNESNRRRR